MEDKRFHCDHREQLIKGASSKHQTRARDVQLPIGEPDKWRAVFLRTKKGEELFDKTAEAEYIVNVPLDADRYYAQKIPIRSSYGKKYANLLRIEKRKR